MSTVITNVIAFPYEIARKPLVALDHRLGQLLPETSGPRVVLDKAIGSADKVAGTVLFNRDIARRGSERIERTQYVLEAARLEAEAAGRREEAAQTAQEGRDQAAAQREAAADRVEDGLEEAESVELLGKQEAEEEAYRVAQAKKTAADDRAATRAATTEQRKEKVAAVTEKKKRAARRTAKAGLDEARGSEQDAAEAKADADRLGDLVETKKQQRTQD